jgi:hypothetical protein
MIKQVFCPWLIEPEGATEATGFSMPETDGKPILSPGLFLARGPLK